MYPKTLPVRYALYKITSPIELSCCNTEVIMAGITSSTIIIVSNIKKINNYTINVYINNIN